MLGITIYAGYSRKKKKKKLDRTYIGSTAQVMSGLEIIQWKLLRKILQKENKTKVNKKIFDKRV